MAYYIYDRTFVYNSEVPFFFLMFPEKENWLAVDGSSMFILLGVFSVEFFENVEMPLSSVFCVLWAK